MNNIKRFGAKLLRYVDDIKKSPTEENKVSYYREFIETIFSELAPNALVPFTCKTVYVYDKNGGYSTKKADLLWNNVLIEFEINLSSTKIRESERQLREYVSGCLTKNRAKKYKLFSSDGITFYKYRYDYPEDKAIITPEDVDLTRTGQFDLGLSAVDGEQISHTRLIRKIRDELTPFKLNHVPIEQAHELFISKSDLYDGCMKILKEADHSGYAIQFKEWQKYQNLVYGDSMATGSASKIQRKIFLNHTYMATIAKVLAYAAVYPGSIGIADKKAILGGRAFKDARISNFITEDFFSWIGRDDTILDSIMDLILAELDKFDVGDIDRDILRSIYETIEEPKNRHELGAVYTPEWLAEMTLDELFEQHRKTKTGIPSILDPACGSGTFLALAVRKIIREYSSGKSEDLLKFITGSVVGFDLHPVAVLFSKTNYLIALKDLIVKRRGEISIPVYMSDTLDFPEPESSSQRINVASYDSIGIYVYQAGDTDLILPKGVVESKKVDTVIDIIQRCAEDIAGNESMADAHLNGLRSRLAEHVTVGDHREIICNTARALADLIRQKKDTIHSFIFKNIYKPAIVGHFDIIVGNPPWVVYRSITDETRQNKLKKSTNSYGLLLEQKNFQAMEMATLFFTRCVDRFLEKGGSIGFVMPRSILQADQHHMFRLWEQNGKIPVRYTLIYDMGKNMRVRNLFTVESCVLFGVKKNKKQNNKIVSYQMGGLPRKDSTLDNVRSLIEGGKFYKKKTMMYLHEGPDISTIATVKDLFLKESVYKDQFFQGATIVPQSLWVVKKLKQPMGMSEDFPLLETTVGPNAKKQWKDIRIKRSVSRKYLFSTIFGGSILPFYSTGASLIVVPVAAGRTSYRMMDSHDLASVGDSDMSGWVDEAKGYWEAGKTERSTMTALDRLDFQKTLTVQNPNSDIVLLYNSAGRNYLVACLIDMSDIKKKTAGFIADYSTYYHYPKTIDEGKYLCTVLNSRYLFECISAIKSSRNIQRTPWEFPIPKFDHDNTDHKRLVRLYEECHVKLKDRQDIKRNEAFEIITDEMSIIDRLVKEIIMKEYQKSDAAKDFTLSGSDGD